jgi:hypothetical protein
VDAANSTALADLVVGDALGRLPLTVQVGVLLLLLATGVWAARRPDPASLVAFVACALVWARANQALEGAVLITLSPEHGLTVPDLLPPALTALILARSAGGRRRASPPPVDPGSAAQASSRRSARVGQAATVRRAWSSSVAGTATSAIMG